MENGVLPIPCHVSGFSFVKIYSFAKWKDVFIMKYFTLNCTASLWLLYSLTILLLGVGCNKILKTKLRCGPSLCFSLLYTYICICKEAPLWQNWPQCQSKCKAVRASLEGQSAALCDDLDRKRAPVGCSIDCSLYCKLWVRRRQCRFCLISGVGFLSSDCRAWYLLDCKPGLIFWKLHLMEGTYLLDTGRLLPAHTSKRQ